MPPLVMLPGMNCNADLWTGLGIDDAITPRLSEPTLSAQVDRLLDELPPVFVLAGLSLGAIVGMALAQRAPERVAALCVMSTNAKAPTDAQRNGWQHWLNRLDVGESPRALQKTLLPALLSDAGRSRPDLVERTLRMGDDTGDAVLRAQLLMQETRTDLRPGLARMRMPVLVISGQQDAICPPAFHAEIAAAVPQSRMVSIEGGHLLTLEHPAAVGALVRGWRARGMRHRRLEGTGTHARS